MFETPLDSNAGDDTSELAYEFKFFLSFEMDKEGTLTLNGEDESLLMDALVDSITDQMWHIDIEMVAILEGNIFVRQSVSPTQTTVELVVRTSSPQLATHIFDAVSGNEHARIGGLDFGPAVEDAVINHAGFGASSFAVILDNRSVLGMSLQTDINIFPKDKEWLHSCSFSSSQSDEVKYGLV
jgi:hypothetical protein